MAEPTYDVFISYCKADKQWVKVWLLARLEGAGLKVCIDYRDFAIGVPHLVNIERAVDGSRHTLIVMTPDWVTSEWNEFESLLVGTGDPAARKQRLLPLLLKPCQPPARIAMLDCADLTNEEEREEQLARVLKLLGGKANAPAASSAPPSSAQSVPPTTNQPQSQTRPARLPPLLADALEYHTLALFIGSDLPSSVTGLPSRTELARDLARRYGLDESLSLADVAQRVSRAGNRYDLSSFLMRALDIAGKSPQPFHRAVVAAVKRYDIKTIITTAYDLLLERAFQQADAPLNVVVRDANLSFLDPARPALIKLYGDVQQVDSLVVTDQDHNNLLRDRDRENLVDEVRQALRRNTVLFVGYNLADPDMRFIWDQIAQSRFAKRAFAVWSGLPQADVEMWRDRGIEILETDPLGILSSASVPDAQPTVTPPVTTPSDPGATPAAPEPLVSVTLLSESLPTAYAYQLDAARFPWLTVALNNTGKSAEEMRVRVTATIPQFAEPTVAALDVERGQKKMVPLLPLVNRDALKDLYEVHAARLRVTVEQLMPRPAVLDDNEYTIRLLARNIALLALRAPDGSTTDLARYLAAWVTPHDPRIEQLLRQAVKYHPKQQFIGYQGGSGFPSIEESVRAQARAIYEALKRDSNLAYVDSSDHWYPREREISQRVRLPVETLAAGGSANCIDGTVLYASLLELACIEPLIVLVPGHAFVGWRTLPGADTYEFVETTMISTSEFEEAWARARQEYEDAVRTNAPGQGMFDPNGFPRLIDIAYEHAHGVIPLSLSKG
ncbi:MAG: SIR2 family protein [Anaerolineae bacterium]